MQSPKNLPIVGTEVAVPGRPYRSASTPDGRYLLVSLRADRETSAVEGIAVIETQTWSLAHVVSLRHPRGLAVSKDASRLLVAQDSGQVGVVDLPMLLQGAGDSLIATVPTVDHGSTGIVSLSRDEALAFTSEERAGCVTVLDGAGLLAGVPTALLGSIPMDLAPISVVPSRDGRHVYATSQAIRTEDEHGPGRVAVLDSAVAGVDPSSSVLARVTVGNAVRLALSKDDAIAWVTLRADNRLVAFSTAELRDTPSCAPIAGMSVGPAPVGVVTALDDQIVLVANSNRFSEPRMPQTISVIDARGVGAGELTLLGETQVGAFPRELSRLPDGSCCVTNFSSATVSIFSPSALGSVID